MHIYLIDDDEVDLVIGEKLLQIFHPEVEVSTFQSPLKALSNLISNVMQPDLIILDWYMNELNAEAWLKCYSTQVKEPSPVYIFTASIDPRERQKAEGYKVVKGFFIKPFSKLAIEKILPVYSTTRN